MKFLRIICLVLLTKPSLGISPSSILYQEIFTYHNETAQKADFALHVVEQIYGAFRQWFFTIIFCDFTYFENRILKYTENMDNGYPVLLLNSCPSSNRTKVSPKIGKHGQTAYVVTAKELSLDSNEYVLEALLKTGVFKPRSPVIFVINEPTETNDYFYYYMLTHFRILWARKISNSVLLVMSDKLRMYAYNPFFDAVNDITNVSHVSNYLAHQYYNLHGHPLRLSVFRKIYISDNEGSVSCDSRLTMTVMKHINATCVPLAPRDGSTVGDLLDNGTATGVTKDLLDGYTDLELNSRILKNSYYGYIDTTYPLYQDDLCFLVKKSDKQSTFTTTIQLISIKMLCIFIFNVKILTTVAIVMNHFEVKILKLQKRSFVETSIDMVKCFLRQTIDIKFLGPAYRQVALLVMLYSLIVNSVIDSVLISAITYPRYKPNINTMQELLATNLTLGIHARHLKLFKNSMSDQMYEKVKKRIEVFNDKKIKQFVVNREFQYAVMLRKSDTEAISRKPANKKAGRSLFHTVLECPIPCSVVYGLRYGSPYLPRLDTMLLYLNHGGILDYWARTDEATTIPNPEKVHKDPEHSKEQKSLTIDMLQTVFYVWMVGLLISAFAFTCEILWHAKL